MYGNWPLFNASLNATSALLLMSGWLAIRAKRIGLHIACMMGACTVSAAFLVSYLLYHARVGSVHFQGKGWVRAVYFGILISHTVLALVIIPLILRTVKLAVQRRFPQHVRLAQRTLPLWFYVCVSGVVVYWMLYCGPWNP